MSLRDLAGPMTESGSIRQTHDLMADLFSGNKNVTKLVIEEKILLMELDPNFIRLLVEKLQESLDEIRQLRDELSQRPLVSSITLYDLGAGTLKVKMPISVVLHETDEESLARWPETRAHGIGSTLSEAISNLKQNIADLFFDLKSREPESLGVIALDTLRILETHLQISR